MNARIGSLLCVAAALFTSACMDGPMEPEVIIDPVEPAFFEAASANDRPLPTFIDADGSAQSGRQLTRASMMLMAPDLLRLVLSTRHVAENGEPGAAVDDTLRAHVRTRDSTLVISRMGTYPLLLSEQGTIDRDGIVLTVEQPLPSSVGAVATPPVKLHFRLQQTAASALDQR